jgi:hypothetical protein
MADERSIFQSDSEEVKQIRSFLETAQLGAYAAKIEQLVFAPAFIYFFSLALLI